LVFPAQEKSPGIGGGAQNPKTWNQRVKKPWTSSPAQGKTAWPKKVEEKLGKNENLRKKTPTRTLEKKKGTGPSRMQSSEVVKQLPGNGGDT